MGDSVNNANIRFHNDANNPRTKEVFLHRHLGNAQINTESPAATVTNYRAFRDAILEEASDSAIHDAGFEAWGAWYSNQVESVQPVFEAVKAAIRDACD